MIKRLFLSLPWRFALMSVLLLLLLGALLPATALAASQELQPPCAAKDLKCVITYGDTQIAKRQASLSTFKTKVTTALQKNELTSAQANSLQNNVAGSQTDLTNYKTKLDAETSATQARQDVNDIFKKLRIYAVVLPRASRELELDFEINAEALMQNASPVLKVAIGLAPSDKQDQLNSLYTDFAAQIAAAQPQIQTAQNALPGLTVDNYNHHSGVYHASKVALDPALKEASTDLHKAAGDLKQMANLVGLNV